MLKALEIFGISIMVFSIVSAVYFISLGGGVGVVGFGASLLFAYAGYKLYAVSRAARGGGGGRGGWKRVAAVAALAVAVAVPVVYAAKPDEVCYAMYQRVLMAEYIAFGFVAIGGILFTLMLVAGRVHTLSVIVQEFSAIPVAALLVGAILVGLLYNMHLIYVSRSAVSSTVMTVTKYVPPTPDSCTIRPDMVEFLKRHGGPVLRLLANFFDVTTLLPG